MAGQESAYGSVIITVFSDTQILVTGEKFAGHGFRAVQPVIEELIRSARFQIQVIAYTFSPFALGFLELIQQALQRGVSVSFVVNRLDEQPPNIREQFSELQSHFPSFSVRSFDRTDHVIHAKALVVDRNISVIGSANFTWGGMVLNHEICVLVKGEAAARVATLLDGIGYDDNLRST